MNRNQQIFHEYVTDEKATLRGLADKHGLTYQRIHAIIGQEAKKAENQDELSKFFTKWVDKE